MVSYISYLCYPPGPTAGVTLNEIPATILLRNNKVFRNEVGEFVSKGNERNGFAYTSTKGHPANPHWELDNRERVGGLCGIFQLWHAIILESALAEEKTAAFPAIANTTQELLMSRKIPDNADVYVAYSSALCRHFGDDDLSVIDGVAIFFYKRTE